MDRSKNRVGAILAVLVASGASLGGQVPCQPGWSPGFSQLPGVNSSQLLDVTSTVRSSIVFDDGTGPMVYLGGSFDVAGANFVSGIARCDGVSFSSVGGGIATPCNVMALEIYDDGGGPALYAAGKFSTAGGVNAQNIAKWNGIAWSACGSGLNDEVRALKVFDDGTGPALYAAGRFTAAGGTPVNRIAKWNGVAWSACGSGLSGSFMASGDALAVFDDGAGPALYVGGVFPTAGGVTANNVARWNGQAWTALGTGTVGSWGVTALATFDDGGGPALYAGGYFTSAGGVAATNIAKWNGAGWSPLGSGTSLMVHALAAFDDGSGAALYVGGKTLGISSPDAIARWNGSAWSSVGGGLGAGNVWTLTPTGSGPGGRLVAGGLINAAGGYPVSHVAVWSLGYWQPIGTGTKGRAYAFVIHDDGTGPALYAGGDFTSVGGVAASGIARFDGTQWTPVGAGIAGTVRALAVHDEGNGPMLFAGGTFTSAGGVPANNVARWDGSNWTPLGGGLVGIPVSVRALAVFDPGGGPRLYAGGCFTGTPGGGAPIWALAQWQGGFWTQVAGGFVLQSGCTPVVHALCPFDPDGSGPIPPRLYIGGMMMCAALPGFVPLSYALASFDGAAWSGLGGAWVQGAVNALAVFDDGSGPALFIGGDEVMMIWPPLIWSLAKWDGTSFSSFGALAGNPNNGVSAFSVFDDGSGPALYLGGRFNQAGGLPASNIARWNGMSWASVGGGVSGEVTALSPPFGTGALNTQALYVSGSFLTAGVNVSAYFARWMKALPVVLSLSQSGGMGSIEIANASCLAGSSYFSAFSFNPMNFLVPGGGSWSGLHITMGEVIAQFFSGAPPFTGTLDAAGASLFTLPAGALPSSLSGAGVYGITHAYLPSSFTLTGISNIASIFLL
jgi:trimeric autotransporter adhesin